MGEYRQIDEPAPTIVGPRPAESAGGKINIPQGIEQLLILSGLNAAWKQKVLADPLAAAREAQIDLSASEQAILKSLPRTSLVRMAVSFEKRSERPLVARLAGAAAVAAAALLAGTRIYAEDQSVDVKGAQAQTPANDEALPIAWIATLPEALAQAAKTGRVVMAVIDLPRARRYAGHTLENFGQNIEDRFRTSPGLRAATKTLSPLSVWVWQPSWALGSADEKQSQSALQDFNALLKKYDIENKLPAVLFLAPDGTLLTKAEQPKDEAQVIDAMKTVPPLLAKWLAAQQDHILQPAATIGARAIDGIRKEESQ